MILSPNDPRVRRIVARTVQQKLRGPLRAAITQGLRDMGRDIFQESQSLVPVGSRVEHRGYWRTAPKKAPNRPNEWSFRKYNPGTLKRSGTFRRVPGGFEIHYNAAYAARKEFGLGDHVEKVDEYFRRMLRRRTAKGTLLKNPRIIGLISVEGFYRFVQEEQPIGFLGGPAAKYMARLENYLQRLVSGIP